LGICRNFLNNWVLVFLISWEQALFERSEFACSQEVHQKNQKPLVVQNSETAQEAMTTSQGPAF
jgi:hypothetical protein